mmetsp:Transcript_12090/g.34974  ORF Transcript_12090/g.34974 Transcript_12090/m.34974 type:complete len:514 (+) Transcript_12090:1070-2611(+)
MAEVLIFILPFLVLDLLTLALGLRFHLVLLLLWVHGLWHSGHRPVGLHRLHGLRSTRCQRSRRNRRHVLLGTCSVHTGMSHKILFLLLLIFVSAPATLLVVSAVAVAGVASCHPGGQVAAPASLRAGTSAVRRQRFAWCRGHTALRAVFHTALLNIFRRQPCTSHARTGGDLSQFRFFLLLLLDRELLLDPGPDFELFSRFALGDVQRLAEGGEVVVDGLLLEATAIRRQALVERDGVATNVLPVGDAGWDLPHLLVFHRELALRRVKNRHRVLGGSPRHLLVFMLGWLHGVNLLLHHLDDALFGAALDPRGVRVRGVLNELCILLLGCLRHRVGSSSGNLGANDALESLTGLLCGLDLLVDRGLLEGATITVLGFHVIQRGVHRAVTVGALLHNGVVLDLPILPNVHRHNRRALASALGLRPAHVQWVLGHMNLGEGSTVPKVLECPRHEALALEVRRDGLEYRRWRRRLLLQCGVKGLRRTGRVWHHVQERGHDCTAPLETPKAKRDTAAN